jgi:heme exporter protein A
MGESSLQLSAVAKHYRRRPVFSEVSVRISRSETLAVTGPNGSGKSTLMKIIAGVLTPSNGTVTLTVDGAVVAPERHFAHLGFVAPYLQMYDEFSAWENLRTVCRIRGLDAADESLLGLLRTVRLADRRNDPVRTYSSGMKQRLKYAFALVHRPALLLLDEPGANLDEDGAAMVSEIIAAHRREGIVVVATNDRAEAAACDRTLDIRDYQGRA